MNIEMVLYLISVISNVSFLIFVICVTSFVALIVFMIGDSSNEEEEKTKSFYFWVFLFSAIILCAFPSEKTMYMILASNAAKKSEIPEKVLKAIEMKLDEYIDEVKDKVKK